MADNEKAIILNVWAQDKYDNCYIASAVSLAMQIIDQDIVLKRYPRKILIKFTSHWKSAISNGRHFLPHVIQNFCN